MKNELLTDFSVDKEKCSVNIRREFEASHDAVWTAWTQPEILDQWWAPKPWVAKTKSMEFKIGGRRLYTMVSPEGQEHWSLADYTSISPKSNFKFLDGFCDDQGNINNDMPRSDWSVDFEALNSSTIVRVAIKHKSLSDLEKMIEMGFKEGFIMGLNQLNELLNS